MIDNIMKTQIVDLKSMTSEDIKDHLNISKYFFYAIYFLLNVLSFKNFSRMTTLLRCKGHQRSYKTTLMAKSYWHICL